MKKAQGLSLNTIIIAILVVIVLIVLIAIFTGQISIFKKDTNKTTSSIKSCMITGGKCFPSGTGCNTPETKAQLGLLTDDSAEKLKVNALQLQDCEPPQVCCVNKRINDGLK